MKFAKKTQNAIILSKILYLRLRKEKFLKEIDVVVPVPLSRGRLKERMYNQAQLIAKHLCRKFRLNMSSKVLIKTKDTLPQAVLNDEERVKNVSDAYKVVQDAHIKNKCVLLIDDVVTTASTVSECSRVLLQAGAKKVYVACVAR